MLNNSNATRHTTGIASYDQTDESMLCVTEDIDRANERAYDLACHERDTVLRAAREMRNWIVNHTPPYHEQIATRRDLLDRTRWLEDKR